MRRSRIDRDTDGGELEPDRVIDPRSDRRKRVRAVRHHQVMVVHLEDGRQLGPFDGVGCGLDETQWRRVAAAT